MWISGMGQNTPAKIQFFYCLILVKCGLTLWLISPTFCLLIFSEKIFMQAVDSISLHWVSDCSLKIKMNDTIVIPPYTQHNFTSMKLHLWGGLGKLILELCHKDAFFSLPVMILLRNKSFICLEKRLVTMDMQSSLFFSIKRHEELKYPACSLSFSRGIRL